MYSSEVRMSKVFENFLEKKIINSIQDYACEVVNLDGIPDFVLFEKTKSKLNIKYTVAFELKLKNWKQAMRQAFKYKVFSNESYVLMPKANIGPALKNIDQFKKYNIGLATLDNDGVFKIILSPKKHPPFSKVYFQNFQNEMIKYNKLLKSKKKSNLWLKIDKVSQLELKLNKYKKS